jgi:hypothetical protein
MPKLNYNLKKFLSCTSSGLETIYEENEIENDENVPDTSKQEFSKNLYIILEEE